jgi:glycosyltransferase involved in cell wall biosynthesis
LENFYSYLDKVTGFNSEIEITGNDFFLKMVGLADQIICVTAFAKRSLVQMYHIEHEKVEVIYNGVKFQTNKTDYIRKGKEQYGFLPKERIILYAGQLEPRKGIDKLIKAFLLIKGKFPETKLVIAGTGDYDSYNHFSQESAGRILFTGKLDKNTLVDFYCFSEMGIIPSQFEQCSYVAIEMMLYGLPLVISDVPGLNELLVHKMTGMVCKTKPHEIIPNSLEADDFDLALQIEYLLRNPEISKKIGLAARENAKVQHSLERMGEKTLKIYSKLLMFRKLKTDKIS